MFDNFKNIIGLGNAPDAYSMVIALGSNLDPIMTLIGAIAYMLGIYFILLGILHLHKSGMNENGTEKPSTALAIMFVGVMLVYLPSSIDAFSITAFGDGQTNPLGYTQETSVSEKVNGAMAVIYKFIGVAGIAAFVYGCTILKGTTEGRGDATVAKGIWHLIGGVAAMHLDFLMQVFRASAGFAS